MHIKRFGIVSMLAFAILLASTAAIAMAETTTTTPEYNLPTQVSDLNFSATLTDDQKVEMSWNEYEPEGFNHYKVIRSQDNTDPVYPDDGYIFVGSSGDLTYTDMEVPAGTSYYRVCSIAKPDRFCSEVITIESETGTQKDTTVEEKTTTETKETTKDPVSYDEADLAQITLSGKVEANTNNIMLTWTVDDESKLVAGFKIVYSSSDEEPVYPGNDYVYLDDNSARAHTLKSFVPGKTYNIRVCQYDGAGNCMNYSNKVSLTIAEGTVVPTTFKDTQEHWAKEYVDYVKVSCDVYGYMNEDGTYTGEYKPDAPITRAELTKMIVQCAYGDISGITLGELFDDVSSDAWYAEAIQKAKEKGWVEGYDDGTFKPNAYVNRAEALKIILLSKIQDEDVKGEASDFLDVVESDWFAKYVNYAVTKGIVGGYDDGTFKPGENITRAEVAKIIKMLYKG